MSELKAIVKRFTRGDRTVRELECGHEQVESAGSRAKVANYARCAKCTVDARAMPVIGKCTAIIVGGRRCGRDAKHVKRGEPRCTIHFHRGVPESASPPVSPPESPDV